MFFPEGQVRVHLFGRPTDLRKSFDGLYALIYAHEDGLSFGEQFATTCNLSPADSARYKEALERLVQHKEIAIVAPDGARRLKASTITDKDQLLPSRQTTFGFS